MDTGVKAYKLLSLFSNPDTFYTTLFEIHVTNLCNKFILNHYVKGLKYVFLDTTDKYGRY